MQQTQLKQDEMVKILSRLSEIEAAMTVLKKLYDEKDQLTASLLDMIGVNNEVQHEDYLFEIKDNFAEKNVVFRPAGVRRFELVVDSKFAREQKAAKKKA